MKRKINIFFHNIRVLKRNKKFGYKLRFVIFSMLFFLLASVGAFSLIKSFATYFSKADLLLDVQTAMFVIEEGEMSFNIDLDKIIPSDKPYVYTFSVSNFNEDGRTDVDLEYTLKLQTTTNMPLRYRLYEGTYNLEKDDIIALREIKQDSDDSWYNLFTIDENYEFTYKENQTNIYYLVIDFEPIYKNVLEYSEAIENIQVIINSKQII